MFLKTKMELKERERNSTGETSEGGAGKPSGSEKNDGGGPHQK